MRDAQIGLDSMVPSTTLDANKRLLFLPLIGHSAPDRDVIFEPTPLPIVRAMLELATVGPPDVVYDLGSGDGRIPMTAAKEYGACGVGVEIDPALIAEARANAKKAGLDRQRALHRGQHVRGRLPRRHHRDPVSASRAQ